VIRLAFALILAATAASCGAQLPSVIREEMARAPRGTVTIVVFTDLQCPYCRRTHAALAPILAERRGKGAVRVVLRHVPLRSHPDARGAARAAMRADGLGAPADYVEVLFTSPDLSEAACERMAVERGVDRERFRRCVADPATSARIEHDTAIFEAAGGDGVPLLFVGRTRIDGEPSRQSLEAAIDEAIASKK
jgi:predicted DsbA family dithiol-disulfide isomerase